MNYITDREKEFDEEFPQLDVEIKHDEPLDNVTYEVQSFHKQSMLGLIGEIENKIERMKVGKNTFTHDIEPRHDEYRLALSDLLSYLKELKK